MHHWSREERIRTTDASEPRSSWTPEWVVLSLLNSRACSYLSSSAFAFVVILVSTSSTNLYSPPRLPTCLFWWPRVDHRPPSKVARILVRLHIYDFYLEEGNRHIQDVSRRPGRATISARCGSCQAMVDGFQMAFYQATIHGRTNCAKARNHKDRLPQQCTS